MSILIFMTESTESTAEPGFLHDRRPACLSTFRKLLLGLLSVANFIVLVSCNEVPEGKAPQDDAATGYETSGHFPPESEWMDLGAVLLAGEPGEWDHFLWGGFAAAILKKDRSYFLYYQGADSYRYAFDETVCGRAIGVATSSDGIHFEKYAGNPVIAWAPNRECEEGAASLALATGRNGDILAFYGANTALDSTQVNTDIRLARSGDGLHFRDDGIVLAHDDSSVWGAGDELFPITAVQINDTWLLYYLPNMQGFSGKLGVAWGETPFRLQQSSPVRNGNGDTVRMWGTGSYVKPVTDRDALILFNNRQDRLQAWSISADSPGQLGDALHGFSLDDTAHAIVLLDRARNTWLLYYQTGDAYRIRVAPYGRPDLTGPLSPAGVNARRVGATRIELSWHAATDPETGVAAYNVYRNSQLVGTVTATVFTDAVYEYSAASYEVAAVNLHGTEGPKTTPVTVPPAPPPVEAAAKGTDQDK